MASRSTDVGPAATTGSANLLGIEGVTHRFKQAQGQVVALEDVSLDVKEGEFVVLVGASGCGKSTLLRLLAGLMEPSEGRIVRSDGLKAERSTGMVFQRPVLLPWRSVLRNVMLPTEIADVPDAEAKARALLAQTDLAGFEQAYPHQLSGGMQQRVAICRALLTDPALLLMDEPFGALDAITRERLNLLLQSIWADSGKTIMLVTHSIEEAIFLADHIVVMSPRPGRVREVIPNDLPRPRNANSMKSPKFAELAVHIRELIVGSASEGEDS